MLILLMIFIFTFIAIYFSVQIMLLAVNAFKNDLNQDFSLNLVVAAIGWAGLIITLSFKLFIN
jgi:hypothetical protein